MSSQYATAVEFVARNPSFESNDPVEIDAALEWASRQIDGYCDRKFWLDDTATIRVFKATSLYVVDLGAHEIGSSSGVTVKTDDGTGTFATTVSSANYLLEPVNAAYAPSGARPYTMLRALSATWPYSYSPDERQELVQVTAKFGWPSVPAAVREACLALTSNRLENPAGVRSEAIDGYSVTYGYANSGGNDAGQDIAGLLAPFRRMWAA